MVAAPAFQVGVQALDPGLAALAERAALQRQAHRRVAGVEVLEAGVQGAQPPVLVAQRFTVGGAAQPGRVERAAQAPVRPQAAPRRAVPARQLFDVEGAVQIQGVAHLPAGAEAVRAPAAVQGDRQIAAGVLAGLAVQGHRVALQGAGERQRVGVQGPVVGATPMAPGARL